MSYDYQAKLNQVNTMTYAQKVDVARSDFEAIMNSVDPKWKINCVINNGLGTPCIARDIRTGIHLLAALIASGDNWFTEDERIFLEKTIDIGASDIDVLKKEGKKYFSNAMNLFRSHLRTEEREKLAEIMIILATIDGTLSGKELKWIKKMLFFTL